MHSQEIRGIISSPKVSVITRLLFEPIYSNVAVQYVNHSIMGTQPDSVLGVNDIKFDKMDLVSQV